MGWTTQGRREIDYFGLVSTRSTSPDRGGFQYAAGLFRRSLCRYPFAPAGIVSTTVMSISVLGSTVLFASSVEFFYYGFSFLFIPFCYFNLVSFDSVICPTSLCEHYYYYDALYGIMWCVFVY